jgi:MFS family permease
MQSSWAVGYALGAAVVALVMPHFGWRAVFFVSAMPGRKARILAEGWPAFSSSTALLV